MTLDERLRSAQLVCLDTSPILYFVENDENFAPRLAPLFESISRGARRAVSSYVTLLELLVHPLRRGRSDLAHAYRSILLGQTHFAMVAVERAVAERAAEIRARYESIKTPDAIQLATALVHRADAFVTNDIALERFTGLDVVVLQRHLDA